jgi:pimeloyl-ACP methyl ester carboxylesterase
MNTISIDGQHLELRQIEGAKALAPIVFLHEGLGSVSLWTQRGLDWPLAVCQATGRAGVVYSRRGYGQSFPAPPGRNVLPPDYMHTQAWGVLPALLDALGMQNPVLLGHSDGATIALLYASRFPISACIAMAPHVLVERIAIASIAAAKTAFESGDLKQRLARHHLDVEGAFWQWNDVWLSAGFATFDIRRDCSRITAPLLLIQGVDDEYGTMAQLNEIALAAPHAQQVRLADCGHSPQRDQPAQSLQAVVDFLQNLEQKSLQLK